MPPDSSLKRSVMQTKGCSLWRRQNRTGNRMVNEVQPGRSGPACRDHLIWSRCEPINDTGQRPSSRILTKLCGDIGAVQRDAHSGRRCSRGKSTRTSTSPPVTNSDGMKPRSIGVRGPGHQPTPAARECTATSTLTSATRDMNWRIESSVSPEIIALHWSLEFDDSACKPLRRTS